MFKKIMSIILTIALVIAGMNFTPGTVDAAVNSVSGSSSWKLVWNDEFNQTVGGAPDTSVWSYDTGHGSSGWGNNEIQNYTSSTNNVYIADMSSDNGSADGRALAIKAIRQNGEITSGRLKTIGKQYMKYGKIEAKIRMENGMQSAVWPAFWMMGNNMNSGTQWPYCGEIDIMEHRNAEQQVIGTLHWNTGTGTGAAYNHVYSGSETTGQFAHIDSMNDWHKYGIEWYENQIKFFLDDVCYQTLDISSAEMEEFKENHFLLLNLAIGGPNSPFTLGQTVSDSFTDATMYVDYVRVYQGTDSDFYIANKNVKETSVEPTTTGDGMTTCSSEKTSLGGWGYFIFGGNAGKYAGGSSLADDFSLKVTTNNKATWGVQAFTQNIDVTAGHTYNVSVDINSSAVTGAILMKDEIGGTDLANVGLASGSNTLSGTFTPTSDTMQLMFNLQEVNAGTTLTFSNVQITDVTGSGSEVTTAEQEATTTATEETTTVQSSVTDPSEITDWKAVTASSNLYYSIEDGKSDKVSVKPELQGNEIYVAYSLPGAFSSVTLNGEALTPSAGAFARVDVSSLQSGINTLTVVDYYGKDSVTLYIKSDTATETTTEETTTVEETTTATSVGTESDITTSTDVAVEGFQISTTYEGFRVVGSVEQTINGQAVKSWGLVYALNSIGTTNNNISDDEMVVGSDNDYIKAFESTSLGTLDCQMGSSTTATYYARTLKFGKKNASAFTAGYRVRAYAVLEDGSYVYSSVEDFNVFDIADKLYSGQLMNTSDAHQYLYENILTIVDKDYQEVDYNWNNTVVDPDDIQV